MASEFDVIIVGGGAAGIGAARRLAAHGTSALLLEASSRLGGRAYTQDLGGYPLDLGCEWLHSGDRNAWVGIAEASSFTGRIQLKHKTTHPCEGVTHRRVVYHPTYLGK